MGGRITVDSVVGKGSRFRVRLPLRQATRPRVAGAAQRQLDGLRALVFENNATQREAILTILRGAGMACEPVLDSDHLGGMTEQPRGLDLLSGPA